MSDIDEREHIFEGREATDDMRDEEVETSSEETVEETPTVIS